MLAKWIILGSIVLAVVLSSTPVMVADEVADMGAKVPDYVAVPHLAYNWMIVVYFFLGGLGAGAFLLSVAADFWKQELKPVAKIAAIIAPLAVGIGLLFLVADLGRPERFWRLFLTFNHTS
ncbi:hypothetical protein LCGC14_3019110, partial [marine sediment metagenome]